MQKFKLGQLVWYYGEQRTIVGKHPNGSYYMSAPDGTLVFEDKSIQWLPSAKPDTRCILLFAGSVQTAKPKFKRGDKVKYANKIAKIIYQYSQSGNELYMLRGFKNNYEDIPPEKIKQAG